MFDDIKAKAASATCTRVLLSLLLLASLANAGSHSPAHPQVSKTSSAAIQIPAPLSPASPPPVPVTPTPLPPDPLGRSTPHGTVLAFLHAAESQDYGRAAKFLDSKLPEKQSEKLALQLKALLDLGASTNLQTISREPEGNLEDDLRVSREKIGVVTTPAGQIDILLDRIARRNESSIWLFSRQTLDRVPSAYASTQHRDLSRYFPAWTSRVRILSIPIWRWSLIVVALIVLLASSNLFTRVLRWFLLLFLRRHMTPEAETSIGRLKGPTFGLTMALVGHVSADYALTALGRHYWIMAAVVTAVVSGAWMLVVLTDIFTAFTCRRLLLQHQIERITLTGLLARLLKILIGVILVIALLTLAGVNVSALIAGLGIGGIALALAAQKTLADLFGGISIVMRGAVRVNDLCTVAGQTGTVEEIGISSLRLRTLDRSVISIPNSKVAEMELENFTLRDQFWIHQTFTLRFDASYATVQKVLDDILDILTHRPDVDATTARIRVIRLTPAGPEIEVFAYYDKPGGDYNSFLAEQEKIIIEMMRIVGEAGTSMTTSIGVVHLDTTIKPPETSSKLTVPALSRAPITQS